MSQIEKVEITTEFIKLDQALKLSGAAYSGSEAKEIVQSGLVTVNGVLEERRGRKLHPGDTFIFQGIEYEIEQAGD